MNKILIVVGTRPNFVKITQLSRLFKKHSAKFDLKTVHTGQHFDNKMSKIFFEQLNILPDEFLNVEGGSPNTQLANIMISLEKSFVNHNPDLVLVVGDVNSTLAAALTANKMNIKIAHIESGLRSFDRSMPEELNRIITDDLSDYFFVTEQSGIDNLIKEGKLRENIFFVGNTMIDTMVAFKSEIDSSSILSDYDLNKKDFILMTMHRPAMVDSKDGLMNLLELISQVSKKYKIVFPIHPRTIKTMSKFNLNNSFSENKNLVITEPLDYFSFQKLIKECKLIITDSGGIQEESTFLQVPCLTLRSNTERPSTVLVGTNELVKFETPLVLKKIKEIEDGLFKKGSIPEMWDGNSTQRIVDILLKIL